MYVLLLQIRYDEMGLYTPASIKNTYFSNIGMFNSDVNLFLFGGFNAYNTQNKSEMFYLTMSDINITNNTFEKEADLVQFDSFFDTNNA